MFMEEGELLEGRKHSNLDAGVAKERASVLIIIIIKCHLLDGIPLISTEV